MIVFADLHLREESEATVFTEVLPGILDMAKHDPDLLIAFLGDWWHVRYRVSIRLQNRVAEWLRECQKAEVRLILLPGNHDQVNEAGENALEVFANWMYVKVYTEPTWDQYGLWIPYRKNPEDIEKALSFPKLIQTRGQYPVLWMHHGVRGAMMNNHLADTEGLPPEMFNQFLVYCGHYHKRQTVGNVTYIGSPYQTRADEAGQDKGFAVWEPDAQKMTYHNRSWGPRFHSYRVDEGGLMVPEGAEKNDELRISTAPGVDPTKLAEHLTREGFTNVVITPEQAAQASRLQVGPQAGVADYAAEFAEQFHGDLDKARLMQTYNQIVED